LRIGETIERSFRVSDEIVRGFAELLGDRNPLHLDDEFAQSTRFGRRIAHGMIAAVQISAVIGNALPGPGTVYLNQTLKFMAPVFIGDTLTTRVTVISMKDGKPIATLDTVCTNQDGKVVLQGEAVVMLPPEVRN